MARIHVAGADQAYVEQTIGRWRGQDRRQNLSLRLEWQNNVFFFRFGRIP